MTTIEVILTLIGVAVAAGQGYLAHAANAQTKLAHATDLRMRKAEGEAERRRAEAQSREEEVRLAEARARTKLEDERFAVAIVETVTTRQVQEIVHEASPSRSDVRFIESLVELCTVKVERLLTDDVKDDETISTPINNALGPLTAFLRAQQVTVDTSRLEQKLGSSDHSKFSWEGQGRHGKIWIINLMAARFVADRSITSVDAFREQFGAEVVRALPGQGFRPEKLLISEEQHSTLKRKYLPGFPLLLDGTAYAVDWSCGFPNTAVGRQVHLPLVQHFRRLGYPATPV